MRSRVAVRSVTSTRMSTIGFAASPGTAVLPKCSTRRTRSFGRQDKRCSFSRRNISGHRGSYGTMAISSRTTRRMRSSSVSIAHRTIGLGEVSASLVLLLHRDIEVLVHELEPLVVVVEGFFLTGSDLRPFTE